MYTYMFYTPLFSIFSRDVNAKETIETHMQCSPSVSDKVWIESLYQQHCIIQLHILHIFGIT